MLVLVLVRVVVVVVVVAPLTLLPLVHASTLRATLSVRVVRRQRQQRDSASLSAHRSRNTSLRSHSLPFIRSCACASNYCRCSCCKAPTMLMAAQQWGLPITHHHQYHQYQRLLPLPHRIMLTTTSNARCTKNQHRRRKSLLPRSTTPAHTSKLLRKCHNNKPRRQW
jgi:hypothetical protein